MDVQRLYERKVLLRDLFVFDIKYTLMRGEMIKRFNWNKDISSEQAARLITDQQLVELFEEFRDKVEKNRVRRDFNGKYYTFKEGFFSVIGSWEGLCDVVRAEVSNEAPLLKKVIDIITEWQSDRIYKDEEGYQIELQTYLKVKFAPFDVKREQGAGDSRIDISIENKIGIELKRLDRKAELDRLYGQTVDFVKFFPNVILVIINLGVSTEDIDNFKKNVGGDSRLKNVVIIVISENVK